MNRAFAVAKKVRSETGISQSAVSVSYAAVELARKIFGDLTGKTVMIIGASKMGELAAKHLKRNGVSSVLVTNRTFERAVELAKVFEGAAVPVRTLHRSHGSRRHRHQFNRRAAFHHQQDAGGTGHPSPQEQADVLHRYRRAARHRSGRSTKSTTLFSTTSTICSR